MKTKFINHFHEIIIPFAVAFATPLPLYLIAVGVIVFTDYYTGVKAARKRGEKITSNERFRSVPKFIIYSLIILCSRFMEVIFFPEFPATKLITAFVCYIELTSIDENVKDIFGRKILSIITDKLNPKRKSRD